MLIDIFPELQTTILKNYNVTLSGFNEGSTLLKLDGRTNDIVAARNYIDTIIGQFQESSVVPKVPLTPILLTSARKRMTNESISVTLLCLDANPNTITVCSFSPIDHDKAVNIVGGKVAVKYVPLCTIIGVEHFLQCQKVGNGFSVVTELNKAEKKVYIKGYVYEDVQCAFESIHALISNLCLEESSPIACSPEQMLYLQHQLKYPSKATQSALASLPARITTGSDGQLCLKGSQKDIEKAQNEILEGPLLHRVLCRSFHFTAHYKVSLQIEKYILSPLKNRNPNFLYLQSGHEQKSDKGSRKSQKSSFKAEETSFTITIYTQDSSVFKAASAAMLEVNPCCKTLKVRHFEEIECLKQRQEESELMYRVKIVVPRQSQTVLVFGLTENDARECVSELRNHIASTVVIKKYIPLRRLELKYLRTKKCGQFRSLKEKCKLFKVFDKKQEEKETVLIQVEGTGQQIQIVEQEITEMIGDTFVVKSFSVACEKTLCGMWQKRWKDIKNEKEQNYDVIVEFTKVDAVEGNGQHDEKLIKYEFKVFGCDEECAAEVEKSILNQNNGRLTEKKTFSLHPEAIKALFKGMREKDLLVHEKYTVNMFIDRRNQVILTAPVECSDDLEAAEQEILRYVGNRVMTEKEIVIKDPAIGLILHSKSKVIDHLPAVQSIAKPFGVSVQYLKRPQYGLLLRGTPESIAQVEPLIQQKVLTPIQSLVGEVQVPIDPALRQFLSTPEFTHLKALLKNSLCVTTSGPLYQHIEWYFTDDNAMLTPYVHKDSVSVEKMFQAGDPGPLIVSGRVYRFDFKAMSQMNIVTSCQRQIVRKASTTETETQSAIPEELEQCIVSLRGPKDNLPSANRQLAQQLAAALTQNEISFPTTIEGAIKEILVRHKLPFTIKSVVPVAGKARMSQKIVSFKGLTHDVHRATSAIQEEIISYHSSAAEESEVKVPEEWEQQTRNLELFPLARGSMEWRKVESRFTATLPSKYIRYIYRIQNKWLWERYAQHKQRLSYKHNGSVNEKDLFHGTRSNDPKIIYEGEDGFDMRFSAQGMWGLANYFAVSASYSNSYSYRNSQGYSEMFLVKVLTGDSYYCESNQSLRLPPEKAAGISGSLNFAKTRYDTVTGITGGSQVYMTYDNDKAYPAYLIQY